MMPEHNSLSLRLFRPLMLVLPLLILSRAAIIHFMPETYSNDLHAWLKVIDMMNKNENPYYSGVLNWPPFWMSFLYFIGKLGEKTSISTTLLIQSVLIAGECITAALSYYFLIRLSAPVKKAVIVIIVAIALNPISILLSCQHCNFDVFAGMWMMLFAISLLEFYQLKAPEYWLCACFFLGMGIFTKTIPFVLMPLLLIGMRQQRRGIAIVGMMLLFVPVMIGMSIIYALAPEPVKTFVLSYRSMAGWYGITGIMNIYENDNLINLYSDLSPYMILAMMSFVALRVWKLNALSPAQLLCVLLSILVFLPTFGPGYSPPYILWFLPFLPVYYFVATKGVRQLMMVGLVILICNYMVEYATFNSHGAFLKSYFPSEEMAETCRQMGRTRSQTLIRLPMLAIYLIFYGLLLRDKNNPVSHKLTAV